MRIIFFGTPRFAATILEDLLRHKADIVAVVTKPDKPVGRSSTPQPPAVKVIAEKNGLQVLQPQKASTPEFAQTLREFNPDLFVVVAYSEIFKEILLTLPPLGCINVHASLLPKYRGAAPIHRCVMAGDAETGVTIMSMAAELDAGEILSVGKIPLGPETTTGELFESLSHLGASELRQVLQAFEAGTVKRLPQDPALATFAPKVTSATGQIDWHKPAHVLHNHIRGLSPKPGAWTTVSVRGENKKFHIKKSRVFSRSNASSCTPGTILPEKGLVVACGPTGQEGLDLLEVQLEGKKAMPALDFVRGILKEELNFVS